MSIPTITIIQPTTSTRIPVRGWEMQIDHYPDGEVLISSVRDDDSAEAFLVLTKQEDDGARGVVLDLVSEILRLRTCIDTLTERARERPSFGSRVTGEE